MLDAEKRAFIIAGVHRLCCSPRERAKDGRYRLLTDETPAYGSADCMCHTRPVTYNGEKINGPFV